MAQTCINQQVQLVLGLLTLRNTKHRQHRLAVQSPEKPRGI
jgi:hypothetical protein